MNKKQLFEKMVDYKRFGVLLLSVGAFFYLGVIIPQETKTMNDVFLMMGASTLSLSGSVLFLLEAKKMKNKLNEVDEGKEY